MAHDPLLPFEEARLRMVRAARPRQIPADINDAIGRGLAEAVIATRTLPPWNNSAMDGYAVRAGDGPKLRIVDRIFAGGQPKVRIEPGTAARIMTGAPMPEGADAVVMQEKARAEDGVVELLEIARPGQNVRLAGEDAREGGLLLPLGADLGIPEAGLLWSQGLSTVKTFDRPRVAILSTGDELCAVTDDPAGRIVDSNGPSIAAAVRRAGGIPTLLGIARDDPSDIRRKLEPALSADVLITSAGVSVGEKDHVRGVLGELGARLDFWKVAIKPGKPLVFGSLGDALVVGLPGNPTSSLVTFELFVRPLLRKLLGLSRPFPDPLPGRMTTAFTKAAGLRHFVRATVEAKGDEWWATPISTQTSGAIRSGLATHLLMIAEETTQLAPGDPVPLLPASWAA